MKAGPKPNCAKVWVCTALWSLRMRYFTSMEARDAIAGAILQALKPLRQVELLVGYILHLPCHLPQGRLNRDKCYAQAL
eukprot:315628-Amphidinium_carterae.1